MRSYGALLLKKVKTTYAECETYQDKGILKVIPKIGSDFKEYAFRTYFKRPSLFLFELRAVDSASEQIQLVWQNREIVYHYEKSSSVNKASKCASLDMAVGLHLPIDTKPCFVFPLLFPGCSYEVRGVFENEYKEASQNASSSTSHVHCHCLPFSKIDVWLDMSEFSITQIVIEQGMLNRQSYDIRQIECRFSDVAFNQEIPMEVFDFNPGSLA